MMRERESWEERCYAKYINNMSRIGKKPIAIPEKIEVAIEGRKVTISGPQGKLALELHPNVHVEKKDNFILVTVRNPQNNRQKALWGLFGSLIKNMIQGVVSGYSKKLEINGIGFKAEVKKNILVLHVGYSHPVEYFIPPGIEIAVEKNIITVFGADKQIVGQAAAEIRFIKKPEPYKGKGIKYLDEVIRRKAGKAVVKTE